MPKKLSNALTPLAVKNAKPGRHADGGGLHLLVKDSGARSWVYRFMLGGKSRLNAVWNGAGIGMATIQQAMGHANIATTAGYCWVSDEQLENAVNVI
jgi:hypothetical protein